MPTPRRILASAFDPESAPELALGEPAETRQSAPELAPGEPAETSQPAIVAFACTPEWLLAEAPASAVPSTVLPSSLPRFQMVAYTGGPMRLAGWRYPVVVDLTGLSLPSQRRPIRLGHDAALGVGHTDAIRIDSGKLIATGVISRDTAAAREVVASSRNGFPWQASIGSSVDEHEFIHEGHSVLVNGRSLPGPLNVVRRATLGEISFVDLGADGNTSALVTASIPSDTAFGDPPVKTTPTATATATDPQSATATPATPATPATTSAMSAAAMATQGSPHTEAISQTQTQTSEVPAHMQASAMVADDLVHRLRAAAVAETERITAVRTLCASKHPLIEAKALSDGWDATRTELEVLRAARPHGPAIHVTDQGLTGEVLEAACLLTAKHTDPLRVVSEKALTLADRRFRGGIGLQELFLEAAWANGYSGRTFRDTRAVLEAAFARDRFGDGVVRADGGASNIDIGGILSNLTNKFLLEGFNAVEKTWRNIAVVSPVTDFKATTRFRLIGKDQYEKVAPGGELKHGTLDEMKYQNQADTYGLLLGIDRRDLINDDLGAITTVPKKLGRGAGLKINDVFWVTFLGHPTFFSALNENLLIGADGALTIDGLTKAETLFNEQLDPDGKPLGTMPSILLVPPSLSALGSQLFKSTELRDTTPGTKFPVSTPHQGKFRVEVSRYLSNPHFPGSSRKAWYLLADPADLPVIEVVFLNGQESPTIESAQADFNTLGVVMRGYHDFGVGLQEPRAGLKVKGEA